MAVLLGVAATVLTVANLVLTYRLAMRRRIDPLADFAVAETIAVFDSLAIGWLTENGLAAAIAALLPMLGLVIRSLRLTSL